MSRLSNLVQRFIGYWAYLAMRRENRDALQNIVTYSKARSYSYEASLAFLIKKGVNEQELLMGSIPKDSLEFTKKIIHGRYDGSKPIIALHIGNLVGVSLCYFTHILTELNPDSLVVSIDPNIRYHEILAPQDYVLELLAHFGLQKNSIVIAGYSLSKNIGSDGGGPAFETSYDPRESFKTEYSCENVLQNLVYMSSNTFDIAIIDGHHDQHYVQSEITHLSQLLKTGSLMIMDDISDGWSGLKTLFDNNINQQQYAKLNYDGKRIGILEKL